MVNGDTCLQSQSWEVQAGESGVKVHHPLHSYDKVSLGHVRSFLKKKNTSYSKHYSIVIFI